MDRPVSINLSNFAYAFMKFHEQYKTICIKLSENKRRELLKTVRMARTFVFEYMPFIDSSQVKKFVIREINKLEKEIINNADYEKLCNIKDKLSSQKIDFNLWFYTYITRLFKVIGVFGDELSKTFMPSRTDRAKLFIWSNNNYFFEQFTYYKSNTSEKLSNFTLTEFKDGFVYLVGFYFAFYLFIDEKSRAICEETIKWVLSYVLQKDNLKLIAEIPENLTPSARLRRKGLESEVHKVLNCLFFRMNYSFSSFGVLPRMETKIYLDRTTI